MPSRNTSLPPRDSPAWSKVESVSITLNCDEQICKSYVEQKQPSGFDELLDLHEQLSVDDLTMREHQNTINDEIASGGSFNNSSILFFISNSQKKQEEPQNQLEREGCQTQRNPADLFKIDVQIERPNLQKIPKPTNKNKLKKASKVNNEQATILDSG